MSLQLSLRELCRSLFVELFLPQVACGLSVMTVSQILSSTLIGILGRGRGVLETFKFKHKNKNST